MSYTQINRNEIMKNIKLTYDNCYELYLLLDNLPDTITYNKVFLLYVNRYKEILQYPFDICSSLKESFGSTDELKEYFKKCEELKSRGYNDEEGSDYYNKCLSELNGEYESCIKEHDGYHAYINGLLQTENDLNFPLIQNRFYPNFLVDTYDKLRIFLEVQDDKNNS